MDEISYERVPSYLGGMTIMTLFLLHSSTTGRLSPIDPVAEPLVSMLPSQIAQTSLLAASSTWRTAGQRGA